MQCSVNSSSLFSQETQGQKGPSGHGNYEVMADNWLVIISWYTRTYFISMYTFDMYNSFFKYSLGKLKNVDV